MSNQFDSEFGQGGSELPYIPRAYGNPPLAPEESKNEVKTESKNAKIQMRVDSFKNKEGVAATFEEDNNGDLAFLSLSKRKWYLVFLALSVLLSLSEPFLVAVPDYTLTIQYIVLAASTFLFLFGYIAVMVVMPSGNLWKRFRDALLPEVWIEIVCLTLGWALIFEDPGMASLRCFRIFRFVWYSEFYRAEKGSPFFVVTFFCHVVLTYLERVGRELFTTSSKGAIVVLGFFFYMAYVFGVAFWQRTSNLALMSPEGGATGVLSECDTLPHCFLIMLRLTFWDGSGFDFVKSLMDYPDAPLTLLLILYMCTSAMVLLNGLIGIFGDAFSSATEEGDSDDEGEDDEGGSDDEEKDKKKNKKKITSGGVDPAALERIEQLCMKLAADLEDLKNGSEM